MNKKSLVAAIGTIAVGYIGYELIQLYKFSKSFSLTGKNFKVSTGKNWTILITFNLELTNTTNIDVPISNINGRVVKDGYTLAKFSMNQRRIAKANGTSMLPITVQLGGLKTLSAMAKVATSNSRVVTLEYSTTVRPLVAFVIPVPVTINTSTPIDLEPYLNQLNTLVNELINKLKKG